MVTRLATWLAYEPVRTYLYGVLLAALVLLNGYGLLTEARAALWGNLAAFILVPAVEKARSRVRPAFTPLTRNSTTGGSSGPHLRFESPKKPE